MYGTQTFHGILCFPILPGSTRGEWWALSYLGAGSKKGPAPVSHWIEAGNFLGYQKIFAYIVRRPTLTFWKSLYSFIYRNSQKLLFNDHNNYGTTEKKRGPKETLWTLIKFLLEALEKPSTQLPEVILASRESVKSRMEDFSLVRSDNGCHAKMKRRKKNKCS